MHLARHIKTILLITLFSLVFGSAVNAKPASGVQNLVAAPHQGETLFNPLMHQGIIDVSTIDMSGSTLGPKGLAGLSKGQTKTALKTAQETYKGSTKVGHALSKHAGRNPDIWGKITGSSKTWNNQAMTHMREIIREPGKFNKVTNDKGITFLEKQLSDGRGLRLNLDHTFKGFID